MLYQRHRRRQLSPRRQEHHRGGRLLRILTGSHRHMRPQRFPTWRWQPRPGAATVQSAEVPKKGGGIPHGVVAPWPQQNEHAAQVMPTSPAKIAFAPSTGTPPRQHAPTASDGFLSSHAAAEVPNQTMATAVGAAATEPSAEASATSSLHSGDDVLDQPLAAAAGRRQRFSRRKCRRMGLRLHLL